MPDEFEIRLSDAGIDPERIHRPDRIHRNVKQPKARGDCVLYWMQQSQRTHWNHALEYAILRANSARLPLMALFVITDHFPEANLRHYAFMIQGLCQTAAELKDRGIPLTLLIGDPPLSVLQVSKHAAEMVCDVGYTRVQRRWRQTIMESAPCPVTFVESDTVVPVNTASGKAEYAARTLRPKILKHLARFVRPVTPQNLNVSSQPFELPGLDPTDPEKILEILSIDRAVGPVTQFFPGGNSAARKQFDEFLNDRADRYTQNSNQPQFDDTSRMSPYLHFGQISPVYLAWKTINQKNLAPEIREAFIEELVVRRELAVNFVYYTEKYDEFSCLPGWAQTTLADHAGDARDPVYTIEALEAGNTHDPYWNAAMIEMKVTGFMHNYMRMYWGKKILEWSKDPQTAFQTLLQLNNRYFLDGRDPNSYAGAGWIFGLHDRAWPERRVFGKIRYMNAAGLERKCDIRGYVKKIERMKASVSQPKE